MLVFILFAVGLMSGCAPLYDANHGSKVNWNNTIQTVDLSASEDTPPVATLDGQKAEKLLKRYRQEKAKAPTEALMKTIGN